MILPAMIFFSSNNQKEKFLCSKKRETWNATRDDFLVNNICHYSVSFDFLYLCLLISYIIYLFMTWHVFLILNIKTWARMKPTKFWKVSFFLIIHSLNSFFMNWCIINLSAFMKNKICSGKKCIEKTRRHSINFIEWIITLLSVKKLKFLKWLRNIFPFKLLYVDHKKAFIDILFGVILSATLFY